jgi:PTH1 family peptidyl-tRNA hydrolase
LKLIIGLGNPGPKYRGTRHNVGFAVVDELTRRHGLVFQAGPADALIARMRDLSVPAIVARPMTFVNRSGQAVAGLMRYFRILPGDLLVVADDVNLPVGRLRARQSGSAGGHNGLKSIVEQLGSDEFPRLRVGVGRGDPRRDLADHVLARFDPEEQAELASAVARTADAVELFVTDGLDVVMNTFNRNEAPRVEQTGE